jgi:MraZ protein
MIFFGEYNIQLDEKNRMRIPSKLRSLVGSSIYLLHGTGGCIFVIDEEEFQKICRKFELVPLSDLKAQDSIRKIMASAFIAEEDAQGRFILPKKAKDYAGIDKQMAFIGVNNRMEIWSVERYQHLNQDNADSFDNLVLDLKEYGI